MTNLQPDRRRVFNNALSQQDLQDQAPNPDSIKVDDRNLAELLSFGARFGALIKFYDLTNIPFGDWSAFFQSDPAVAAAVRGALDIPEIRSELKRRLAEARAAEIRAEHERHTKKVYRTVIRLLVIIGENLETGEENIDVFLSIASQRIAYDHICEPLERLCHHREHYHDHHDWRLREIRLLEDLILSLLEELEGSVAAALNLVESSLHQRGHAPQAALWNTFIILYQKSRRQLNSFPRRLLDFYYQNLLQQSHRDAVPAETYLTFELAKNTSPASVPKATKFSAGTDSNGDTIIYESNSSLEVVPATVLSVSVHRISAGEDEDGSIGFLSGTVSGSPHDQNKPFPAFGGSTAGSFGAIEMEPTYLGFVISNPVLMLTGGNRKVSVLLSSRFEGLSAYALDVTTPVQREDKGGNDPTRGEWFSLLYSTAGGWIEVKKVSTWAGRKTPLRTECFEFYFELPPEAPPLVACSTKPETGAVKPDLPADAYPNVADQPTIIMRLMDQPNLSAVAAGKEKQISIAQYQILSEICVAAINFNITVDGLIPEKMSSSGGSIDPSQNFPIFGLAPPEGASFNLSVPELFVKTPREISLTINWAGLPANSTGFSGWYKNYVVNDEGARVPQGLFHNNSFKASFSITSAGLWSIAEDAPLFLFQAGESDSNVEGSGPAPSAKLNASSKLGFLCRNEVEQPAYFNPSKSELKLTLTEPQYGFGATIYSRNLMAASAANATALRHPPPKNNTDQAKAQLAKLEKTNTAAKSSNYHKKVETAVQSALSILNREALTALHAAIPLTRLVPDHKFELVHSLETAAGQEIEKAAGNIWRRISGGGSLGTDHAETTHSLFGWLESFTQAIMGHESNALHERGSDALSTAKNIATSWETAKTQPAGAARATMAASLASVTPPVPVPTTSLPNPPWLPMASSVQVHYFTKVRLIAPHTLRLENIELTPKDQNVTANAIVVPGEQSFLHLNLFNRVTKAWDHEENETANGSTPLLPPVDGKAALYIELSQPVSSISLLFILEAAPTGWSTSQSELSWEMKIDDKWLPAAVMSDSTQALNTSGIIVLQIVGAEDANGDVISDPGSSKHLRAVIESGTVNTAYIKTVTTNAVPVTWMPVAGAKELAVNMPAGTIKQSEQPLSGIAKIDQPMESFNGVPPLVGRSFDQWMAQHLHHKGFAIAEQDFAKIGLTAVPYLWQLAVIPATDSWTGQPSPGHVWLAAVAGKDAPNISDTTIPEVDPTTLNEIGEAISAVASPFLNLSITNPPWVRITVVATLEFSQDDTVAAWIAKLQDELIQWLSPWVPDAYLGSRPRVYWTRQEISEFVRNRPYVEGISQLHLKYDPKIKEDGYYYFTSALEHELKPPSKHVGSLSLDGSKIPA